MCHALSPYEKDPCSFWGRLVSSYITDIGEDGVRRCGLMVDLSSRVMSTGNWRWFKVLHIPGIHQAEPVLCSSLHLHKRQ